MPDCTWTGVWTGKGLQFKEAEAAAKAANKAMDTKSVQFEELRRNS
jgi:hypothetical protein